MKIVACPVDKGGVGFYRLMQPIGILQETETNLDIQIHHELPVVMDRGTRLVKTFGEIDADIVILQVPMIGWLPNAIRDLQSRGIKVVVEIDDDYEAMDAFHSSFHLAHPKSSPARNWKVMKECARLADLVTCSTPAIAARYGFGKAVVLPNYISEGLLSIPRHSENDNLYVGWTGGVGVHPNDLQVTHGGVAQAVFECEAKFLAVGTGSGVKTLLNLYEEPEITGWVDFEFYPAVMSRIDVGIVPLAGTRFNAAKSWLKGLEFAALGIPFVASDVAEYRSLADLGVVGQLVPDRGRSWRSALKSLLTNDRFRIEAGQQNRQIVAEHLTIEENAWRWAEAWESVLSGDLVR